MFFFESFKSRFQGYLATYEFSVSKVFFWGRNGVPQPPDIKAGLVVHPYMHSLIPSVLNSFPHRSCLIVCLFVCLLAGLFVCLLACLFVCLSVCLFVCLSVCLFVFQSASLSFSLYFFIHSGFNLHTTYTYIYRIPQKGGDWTPTMNLYFATFFVGVNTAAAKSFLGAASSVGDSLTADSSSSSQAQGARAAQLRVLETWLAFICSRANGDGYQVGCIR